ncbi:amidohydrolase family protein [Nocardia sp. R7R-8]|uniref:amidohydrolase family protein n=1 Tax=Nocardia sp. R7R-8 TaxID=3459304 RepID=UPI00403D8A85
MYGETTLAAEAIRAQMPIALGADWLPTWSASLLAEMKVAQRVLAEQGAPVPPDKLVQMVTSDAAHIAGINGKIGVVHEGASADILVLERHHNDPYENVLAADPSWVDLVCIGGDICYAR